MRELMTKFCLQRFGTVASILLLLLLAPPQSARAQDDIDQTVARISFVSGSVSYSRGDDPDEWDSAIVNVPLTLGDKIYAPEDGRAELQLPGGNFIRVGHRTYFTALNLTYDVKQFYLGEGAAAFNIRRLGSDEVFEVDTPNVAVTLDGPGKYRVEVDQDGNTRILVRRGRVVVAANGRQITAQEGEIHVYGIDSPRYEMVALRSPDAFENWVNERDDRFERAYADARRYASDEVVGIEDLRDYGRWEDIPEYGRAWTPVRVAVGWRPYTVGHWFWQDPWGWTWISEEPWGWAPSHYGRWTFYRSRWYWVPVGPRVRVVRYAPAVVAFVRDRDDVGWFPLHPRDRFIPWWGRRAERNAQNITYVNRTYVTVVNQNTFISSRNVTNNIVRDSVIVREAKSVRVMEQPLPIPNRSSLRVRGERDDRKFQRPPATVVSRPAVVRVAPVPPPPTFQEKLPEIQKTKGEPVAPDKAQTMGLANLKASNRRNSIRPAAVESGRGDFAPRTPGASAPAPQPLTAPRGKKLATAEEPVVTKVPQRPERSSVTAPSEPSKGSAGPPEGEQQQDRGPQKRGKQSQEQQQLREEQKRQGAERQQLQEQGRQPRQPPPQVPQGKEQPQVRKGSPREEQKGRDSERQQAQEQERQSRQPPPQVPQKEQSQVRKGPQREEQKGRGLERKQAQEQERQKQETRLQQQPRKEAPQLRKEPQREEPGREQLERRQPQKQERDLQQTKSQERKAPPEPRKESQRERQKRQEEEKKGETPEPGPSSSVTR